MDVDDYTQTVSQVMRQERYPLTREAVLGLWETWKRQNPEALRYMLGQARAIEWKRGIVSTKYLAEKLRYESGIRLRPVVYYDQFGRVHKFGLSNTLTHMIGKWLQKQDAGLNVTMRKSRFD